MQSRGSPRARSGFGATDYRRSGCQSSDLPLSQKALLVGRSMPGRGRERGREPQPARAKGYRQMRRILNQAANAAVKRKGSIFEIVYRRLVPRLGHNKTIGVIAHRLCHLIWIILHNGVRYEERGPAVSKQSQQRHTARMIRKLRMLGYRVEPIGGPA